MVLSGYTLQASGMGQSAKVRPTVLFMGMDIGPREISIHNINICRDTCLHFQICGKRFADSFNTVSAFTVLQDRRTGQGIKSLTCRISCQAGDLSPSEDMPQVASSSDAALHDCPGYSPSKGGKPLCHKVLDFHSHSIVAGGLEEISYTTRLTPRTSLIMRLEMRPKSS